MTIKGHRPAVCVIVLNWNGIRDTLECLASVERLEYPDMQILVVDNGSADDSVANIRRRFPSATLLCNETNLGFTGGNNVGISKALALGAEYVWLLNNDTVVAPDTLGSLVAAIEGTPEAGLASPVIRYYAAPDRVQFRGSFIDWTKRRIVKLGEHDPLPAGDVNLSLWGTALLIRRDVLETIGFLNDKYFAYHEDEEYCIRAARAGYRCIVVSDACVLHKDSGSTGGIDTPLQAFLRSRNLYFLWMDVLKGTERILQVPRYLAQIISYGGLLTEKELSESVNACLDGVWHAFRGVGGPKDPDVSMPVTIKKLFRLLFSWHPFLWSSLLRGDLAAIGSNVRRRFHSDKPAA